MKCILTGADGFVGKNLLPQLIDRGYDVDKLSVRFDDFDYLDNLEERVADTDIIFFKSNFGNSKSGCSI